MNETKNTDLVRDVTQRKAMVRSDDCSSLRLRMRDKRSGPISEIVVRSWIPFSP